MGEFMEKDEIESRAREIMKKITEERPCGKESKIMRLGRRYVMISIDYFPYDIMKDLEELFGPVGDSILYRGGEKVGKRLVKDYTKIAPIDNLDIFDVMSAIGWYFGWGVGCIKEDNGKYVVRVYDSFEAESYIRNQGISNKPVCHFLRGVLVGVIEEITKDICKGTELKCKAKGDDYCEFLIERK